MILLISNNNTVHGTIKMTPNEVIDNYYAKNYEIPNKTNPKFKVGDHVRISTTIFLLKDMLQIGQKKFLLLIKIKMQFLGLMLLVI